MKIEKYTKDKGNKYKVTIDGENVTLYDDTIVKYRLLYSESIDESLYKEIIKYNDTLSSYYLAVKYINKKLRSELEIRNYLHKKELSNDVIETTIKHLKKDNYLNEEIYIKAYISDAITLSKSGPIKIRKDLIKLGLNASDIDAYLSTIDSDIWIERINQLIAKKIKVNHTNSSNILKMKITNELINLGYNKENITSSLSNYDIIDKDILKHEYERAKKVLERKYSGYELEQRIKQKLYAKGFKISDLGEYNEE